MNKAITTEPNNEGLTETQNEVARLNAHIGKIISETGDALGTIEASRDLLEDLWDEHFCTREASKETIFAVQNRFKYLCARIWHVLMSMNDAIEILERIDYPKRAEVTA